MADKVFILEYLQKFFESVTPYEFYRDVFPPGELAAHNDYMQPGKFVAIAVELLPKEENKVNARRFVLTDELDYLDELLKKDNFIIVSPISYIGKSREAKAARYIYGIAIDLDGIEKEQNIIDMFYQMENDLLPYPTYIVWSGGGVHLYYLLKQPLPCYENITKQLAELKNELTRQIWNKYITSLYQKPQYQSIFQGFRICGGVTKSGSSRTQAFRIGDKTTIEELNNYVAAAYQVKDITYKSSLTLREAQAKFPSWYEKRVVQQRPKGKWTCKKDLYNWWKRRILEEAKTGHRYYCCMVLAIYAKKCGVSREELEQDAFSLIEPMEKLTTEEANHFTREDILAALELYNDNYYTFPIDTIVKLTDMKIEKNKRNHRKQKTHLKIARATLEVINEEYKEEYGRCKQGRKSKAALIDEWQQLHPGGTKKECLEELKISTRTLYKYWKEKKE